MLHKGEATAGGRPGFHPWVGKIPWRRERLSTPEFWPREFHGGKVPAEDVRIPAPPGQAGPHPLLVLGPPLLLTCFLGPWPGSAGDSGHFLLAVTRRALRYLHLAGGGQGCCSVIAGQPPRENRLAQNVTKPIGLAPGRSQECPTPALSPAPKGLSSQRKSHAGEHLPEVHFLALGLPSLPSHSFLRTT